MLKTRSYPLSLYRGHESLSSAHIVLGLPVSTKDMRYFCILTAVAASTEVVLPPGPPVDEVELELDEVFVEGDVDEVESSELEEPSV